ncbi:hypothetical protein K491DRAFT_706975 [Lophiostoma macrostomum CBS 122681]|uniref:Uncharacterized protein n=1 Tax=Lophiostoma macrostomum CBS 122681 TaxID=1314788 RepID=A0A6A6SZ27_9PLEO|nr:hypothetical protein K491DRAFT_706975 [Lophiostoma macrostomum CBS 122681]
MAPLRRYLRITKHSVLEVRIYLDRPSDAEAWLLRRDNPALPRVIQAIRPLVLPKLREENERARGKGGSKTRKKGVKDVVAEDDFEVSIFLTDLSSRHSVLTKQKIFKENPRIQSNSSKLTSWLTAGTSEQPVVIAEGSANPALIRQEDEDEAVPLEDIPEASINRSRAQPSVSGKRRRGGKDEVVISSGSDTDDSFQFETAPRTKRRKRQPLGGPDSDMDDTDQPQDDKKKLGLNTSYDGFSIYGRILCLVVKRKGSRTAASSGTGVPVSSQQMLENWVSTQAAAEQLNDDDDNV